MEDYPDYRTEGQDIQLGILQHCGHYFHHECIINAMTQSSNECPLCRRVIISKEDIKVDTLQNLHRAINQEYEMFSLPSTAQDQHAPSNVENHSQQVSSNVPDISHQDLGIPQEEHCFLCGEYLNMEMIVVCFDNCHHVFHEICWKIQDINICPYCAIMSGTTEGEHNMTEVTGYRLGRLEDIYHNHIDNRPYEANDDDGDDDDNDDDDGDDDGDDDYDDDDDDDDTDDDDGDV